jgi:hypothetical protein
LEQLAVFIDRAEGVSLMSKLPEPEIYTPERIAEFLLNNATTPNDYAWAIEEVLSLGVDPTTINPDYLFHDEPWQNPQLYVAAAKAKLHR